MRTRIAVLVAMPALVAVLGSPVSAQGAVFCEVNEAKCPAESIAVEVGFSLAPESSLTVTNMVPTAGALRCTSSGISMIDESPPSGPWALEPSVSGCGGEFYFNCVASFEPLPYSASIGSSSEGNGEITVVEGAGGEAPVFKAHCEMPLGKTWVLVTCRFAIEGFLYEFEGGNPAVAWVEAPLEWLPGSTYLCSNEATLRATYEVNSPEGDLYLTGS